MSSFFLDDCLTMLYVTDMRRSIAFYRDVFGFGLVGYWDDEARGLVRKWVQDEPPGYVRLRVGQRLINLHITDDAGPFGAGLIHHVRVVDVDAFHGRLTTGGLSVPPPKDQPWGWRQIYVKDPDGHHFSFYTTD